MRLSHVEAFAPVCPACRAAKVALARVVSGDEREVEEGALACAACKREFPILDGIPLLVKDLGRVANEQALGILGRADLSEATLALLGERAGQSSALDQNRQHLSTYAWAHWGDQDPLERPKGEAGAIAGILARGLERVRARSAELPGPILDLGCSVGRTSLELARATRASGTLVLGIDLNFSMLRFARRVLKEGRARYARRELGMAYEERGFPVSTEGAERVDFWCADALSLPVSDGKCGLVASLNLLDCVASPLDHLRSLRDSLRKGGSALLATPFDWSPVATAPEAWLGGPAALRSLLSGSHPDALPDLVVRDELAELEWNVRLHARSVMRYLVDLLVLERT